ncbi:MAG: MFS transporter [Ilumatobacter sp.]
MRRPVPLYLASFVVIGLSLTLLGPALSELRERSDSGIAEIGVLFVAQSLGYIIGAFGGGRLLDRFDGHRVYAVFMALIAASLLLVPVFSRLAALFMVFLVLGATTSVIDVGANALIIWHLGAEVGRSMNLLHLCFGLGAHSAPLVVGVDLEVATTAGAVLAAATAVWALLVPAPVAPTVDREEQTAVTNGLLFVAATFFFMYVGVEVGFGGWIHTYGEELDFSSTGATWLTAVFWIAFTGGRLLSAAIVNFVRPKLVLTVACVSAVAISAVMVVGDGALIAVWSGAVVMGLATAPQFPVMFAYLERRVRLTGSATAWFIGAAGLGGLVIPYAIGFAFDSIGARALPLASLVFSFATLAAFANVNRRFGG